MRRRVAELLLELASGRVQQLFAIVGRALGQSPCTVIPMLLDRAARVCDEQLNVVVETAEEQQTGGQLGQASGVSLTSGVDVG
jgi:hypothetical protein